MKQVLEVIGAERKEVLSICDGRIINRQKVSSSMWGLALCRVSWSELQREQCARLQTDLFHEADCITCRGWR